jgi:hypothetical protein
MKKVLIACEESQIVTKAFRSLGIVAFSCDTEPCSGGYSQWHIQCDVTEILYNSWDMVLAFPPCTHLCSSGARWFKEKQADGRQQAAIDFFMQFITLDCPWAIENPVGIMSRIYRKPDQYIQPWQYSHGETKKTCLWLNKLPLLIPTDVVHERAQRVWYMSPSPNRSKERSKTYAGVAKAMAQQWGRILYYE